MLNECDQCRNPLCSNPIESETGIKWRRTPKKFCSDECKGNVWALRKAADLLSSVTPDKKLEILNVLSSSHQRDTNGNKQDEISMEHLSDLTVQREPVSEMGMTNKTDQIVDGDYQRKAPIIRRYACEKWPQFSIGRKVRFSEGFFETSDTELISVVEKNEAYGAQIRQVE